MHTPEVITYIQQELALGISPEEVKAKLVASGWQENDVKEAISFALHPATKQYTASSSFLRQIFHEYCTLFQQSLATLKNNIKTILLLEGLQVIILTFWVLEIFSFSYANNVLHIPKVIGVPLHLIAILIVYYFSHIPQLSILYAINDEDRRLNIREYISRATRNVWRFWLILFFVSLLMVLSVFIIFFILFFLAELIGKGVVILGVIAKIVAFLLFMVTIILFITRFLFASYVLVDKNTGVVKSLKQSNYYARNQTLRIFLHLVFLGIAIFTVSLIPVVGLILNLIILAPFVSIYFYKLYKNIKMSAEFLK